MVEALRKEERLEIRLTPTQKSLFLQAAALHGQTLTEFSIRSLQESAQQTLREYQQIVLNSKESEFFINALLGTIEIPQKLETAFSRHYSNVKSQQRI